MTGSLKTSFCCLVLTAIASDAAAIPWRFDDENQAAMLSKDPSSPRYTATTIQGKKRHNALVHQIYDELHGGITNDAYDADEPGAASIHHHQDHPWIHDTDLTWKGGDALLVGIASTSKGAETTLRPYLEDTLGFETTACDDWGCEIGRAHV